MAEHEPTPEQLAAIAAENEESEVVNYKPPAQKSLQEIQELDKDDESLRKYKEALLGSSAFTAGRGGCMCRPKLLCITETTKNIFLNWNKTIKNYKLIFKKLNNKDEFNHN